MADRLHTPHDHTCAVNTGLSKHVIVPTYGHWALIGYSLPALDPTTTLASAPPPQTPRLKDFFTLEMLLFRRLTIYKYV